MTTRIVRDHVYFGGAIRKPGDEIEIGNDADLKSLEQRNLIEPENAAKRAEDPENKLAPQPENKQVVEPANKAKAKR